MNAYLIKGAADVETYTESFTVENVNFVYFFFRSKGKVIELTDSDDSEVEYGDMVVSGDIVGATMAFERPSTYRILFKVRGGIRVDTHKVPEEPEFPEVDLMPELEEPEPERSLLQKVCDSVTYYLNL